MGSAGGRQGWQTASAGTWLRFAAKVILTFWVIALFVGALPVFGARRYHKLAGDGVRTVGVVVGIERDRGLVTYEFDAEGFTFSDSGHPSNGGVRRAEQIAVGDQIPVTYDPADPENSVIGDPSELATDWSSLVLIVLGVALVVSALAATRWWPKRAASIPVVMDGPSNLHGGSRPSSLSRQQPNDHWLRNRLILVATLVAWILGNLYLFAHPGLGWLRIFVIPCGLIAVVLIWTSYAFQRGFGPLGRSLGWRWPSEQPVATFRNSSGGVGRVRATIPFVTWYVFRHGLGFRFMGVANGFVRFTEVTAITTAPLGRVQITHSSEQVRSPIHAPAAVGRAVAQASARSAP